MEDQFESAIAALRGKLDEQHRAILDTKRSINLLLKMGGSAPEYAEDDDPSSSSVRQDQFFGKGLTTSAAEYLAMRKQACQPAEILRALEMGGFDFDVMPWKEDDRLRSFTISLSKNTGNAGKFHKLKNGSFGLRSWYDEDFLKKSSASADATASAKKKAKKKKAGKSTSKPPVAAAPEPAPVPAAKEKAAVKAKVAPKPETEKSQAKHQFSPEGLKRIADAQKTRWAKFRRKSRKPLPEKKSHLAVDQMAQKEAKATM
jgi:hypothetical protein